jgi:hypothetical protein
MVSHIKAMHSPSDLALIFSCGRLFQTSDSPCAMENAAKFSLRLPTSLRSAINQEATKRQVTRTDVVRLVLNEYFSQKHKTPAA